MQGIYDQLLGSLQMNPQEYYYHMMRAAQQQSHQQQLTHPGIGIANGTGATSTISIPSSTQSKAQPKSNKKLLLLKR